MRREQGELEGVGGVRLHTEAWLPDGDAQALVVLVHGMSEHIGRYDWVCTQLVERGIAVRGYDHRGHGRSGGKRVFIEIDAVVRDLDTVIDAAAAAHPGLPLFLVGHSFGGLVSIAYAVRDESKLTALALSAPLAALEAASPVERIAARVLSKVVPGLGLHQVNADHVSTDPGVVEDYQADPLNWNDKIPARTIQEMIEEVARFPDTVPNITVPLLVMHSPDDRITTFAGSEMVHDRASSKDKTLIRYDGMAHEILNEPDRARVVGDLADWIAART